MSRKYNWPTREQWAEQVRSAYFDCENPIPNPASCRLSDYATAEEIAGIVASLKQSYKEHGRKLKAAKEVCGPDIVAKMAMGATRAKAIGFLGYFSLSEAEQALYDPVNDAQWTRQKINGGLKSIREDVIPRLLQEGAELPEFAEIVSRYEVAKDAAIQAFLDDCARRPIDDAAWEKELERRRKIDERDSNPANFIHRIG